MSLGDESLEWHSILEALRKIPVEEARSILGERGTVAYTDGACVKIHATEYHSDQAFSL